MAYITSHSPSNISRTLPSHLDGLVEGAPCLLERARTGQGFARLVDQRPGPGEAGLEGGLLAAGFGDECQVLPLHSCQAAEAPLQLGWFEVRASNRLGGRAGWREGLGGQRGMKEGTKEATILRPETGKRRREIREENILRPETGKRRREIRNRQRRKTAPNSRVESRRTNRTARQVEHA